MIQKIWETSTLLMTGNASNTSLFPAFFPIELYNDLKKSPKPGIIFKPVESSSFFGYGTSLIPFLSAALEDLQTPIPLVLISYLLSWGQIPTCEGEALDRGDWQL